MGSRIVAERGGARRLAAGSRRYLGRGKSGARRWRGLGKLSAWTTDSTTDDLPANGARCKAMVELYCQGHAHASAAGGLCADCAQFLAYAGRRLEKCPYGPSKPTCAKCPIHCYKPQPRELARQVMRYAGPRMVWRHPWLSLTHVADKLRRVAHPMTSRRRDRA
jgi:hypothetical protein